MKRLLTLFMALAMVFVLGACQQTNEVEKKENNTTNVEEVEEVSVFTMTLTTDNQSETLYKEEIEFEEGDNLLEIMKDNIEVVEEDGFITELEGVAADSSKKEAWFFSINGEDSMVGAGDYELEDGDLVNWDLHNWE